MESQDIIGSLQEIFRENFDNDTITISRETTAGDIEGWNSLEQVNLLMAIEEEYGIKFKLSEVSHLENVGDIIDVVEKKIEK